MASAQAAGPNVDAGALLRQAEQELKTPLTKPSRPPRKVTPSAATSPSDATVVVRQFQFSGNTLLSNEALADALVSFTNRPLTLQQLKEAAEALTNTYREAGWTVRAFLPKQEIVKGVVTIQIVEAVFGGAQLQSATPQRVNAERLLDMAEAILPKGQPIHANSVDRALLLLDDLPGINVTGYLVEGQRDGETNLALSTSDEAVITGTASVDNQGAVSTGTDRLNVNLNLNSPLGLGDALTINALKTQGNDYQRMGYTLPIGNQGWRGGIHASTLNYHVITPDYESADLHGTATTQGWDISYPLVRSQLQNLNFAMSYDTKKFDNSANKFNIDNTFNSITSSYNINVYNASLTATQSDNWAGGGVTTSSIGITTGDKSTDTRYTKYNLSLSRLQSLNPTLSFYVAASAQATDKNLDSSEKIYLGGYGGVRAYPSSEAGGSEGNTLTLELRQRLSNNLTLTGFYDYGRVKVNADNTGTSVANPNDYNLQGYGLSVTWQAAQNLDMKATWSQRIDNNPAAISRGNDSDGTKKINRIWLSAAVTF